MNFPQPGPLSSAVPGHPCPGTLEEAIHSFMCEGTPGGNAWKQLGKDIPSLAGKRPRSSGRRWAIVCPGDRPGFFGPCLEEDNVCVCLVFPSALPVSGVPGAVSAARGWGVLSDGVALPWLIGIALIAHVVCSPLALCPVCLWVHYLGHGGGMQPWGGWICFGITGYHAGMLKGRVCCNAD